MRNLILAGALALLAGQAVANDVYGVWATQKSDEGKFLHVEVHACKANPAQVCGTIVEALGGADTSVVGKPIIWDMEPDGQNAWSDGKIWKADDDEVYDSEMALKGNVLQVSGCILFGTVCRAQDWPRVQ
ncbi:MAG: DUF2147 domain-containing protein [Pseudomonadota bacterium]